MSETTLFCCSHFRVRADARSSVDEPVFGAGKQVSRGVVVQYDDTAGVAHTGDIEHLAGVNDEALGVLSRRRRCCREVFKYFYSSFRFRIPILVLYQILTAATAPTEDAMIPTAHQVAKIPSAISNMRIKNRGAATASNLIR